MDWLLVGQVRSQTYPPFDHDWEHIICCHVRPVLNCLDVQVFNALYRWVQSTTFASYMLSRVVGGLSEGNVQLAMYVAVACMFYTIANPYFQYLVPFFQT